MQSTTWFLLKHQYMDPLFWRLVLLLCTDLPSMTELTFARVDSFPIYSWFCQLLHMLHSKMPCVEYLVLVVHNQWNTNTCSIDKTFLTNCQWITDLLEIINCRTVKAILSTNWASFWILRNGQPSHVYSITVDGIECLALFVWSTSGSLELSWKPIVWIVQMLWHYSLPH